MANIKLPTEIFSFEVLSKLELDQIYSFCQSTATNRDWLRQCNQAEFWRRIGQEKYPQLTDVLTTKLVNTSIGKFYHTLAKYLYHLNIYLQQEDYAEFVINAVKASIDPYIQSIITDFWLADENIVDLNYKIIRLSNGKYAFDGRLDFLQSKVTNERSFDNIFFTLSPDSFVEYFIALYFIAGEHPTLVDTTIPALDDIAADFDIIMDDITIE